MRKFIFSTVFLFFIGSLASNTKIINQKVRKDYNIVNDTRFDKQKSTIDSLEQEIKKFRLNITLATDTIKKNNKFIKHELEKDSTRHN